MQTEIIIDPSDRITTVKYQPEYYDAFPPSPTAWVDGRIIGRNRDREAASQALLLYPFVSGRFHPAHGCGVDVAGPLRDLFLPRNVVIEGVELSPTRIPSGFRTAVLCDGSYRSAALLGLRKHDLVFRLSESAYTTSIGPRNVIVSSNFGLFAPQVGQLNALIPAIAAALLFAEDLGIARVVLPINDLTAEEAELFPRLTTLLAAVNVALDAPLLGADFSALAETLPQPAGLEIFFEERHEHRRFQEDLPDFWFARLLSARANDHQAASDEALSKLRALSRDGHTFSPRERDLVWAPPSQGNK